jgi:hypothetical protein
MNPYLPNAEALRTKIGLMVQSLLSFCSIDNEESWGKPLSIECAAWFSPEIGIYSELLLYVHYVAR